MAAKRGDWRKQEEEEKESETIQETHATVEEIVVLEMDATSGVDTDISKTEFDVAVTKVLKGT